MKKKIEDKWDGLHARVTELLAARQVHNGDLDPGVTYGLVTNSPLEIAASGIPSPANPPSLESGKGPDDVVPGEVIDLSEVAVPGDEVALAAELQRQHGGLRLAFGESGHIGERTCQQAIADIKAELRYLEQPDALLAGSRDDRTEHAVANLLRQRRGLRGKLIAGQLSEDFYCDVVADISAELKDLGWSQ
jgi:hypothetical protein